MKKADFKRSLVSGLVASAMATLAAGGAIAADSRSATTGADPASRSHPGMATSGQTAHQSGVDMRASEVIGMKVRNPQDENLGKIEDLVIDTNNQRVAYAVLSFGGIMGVGDKRFTYPVSVFTPTADRKELVLNLDKDRLKQAPSFEANKWPDWNNDNYRAQVDAYFGPTITPKTMPNQHLARASDMVGKDVKDRSGQRIGEVDDLVVNMGNGRVRYAVLEVGKPLATEDTLVPMALGNLTMPADKDKDLVAKVTRSQIDVSHGFKSDNWPDLNDPAYQRRINSYLGSTRNPAGAAGPTRTD